MKLWKHFSNIKTALWVSMMTFIPAISQTSTATSPEAGLISEGGTSKWKTTLVITSFKPYWFIKSAEVSDPVSRRACTEDTSPGKAVSKSILGDIKIMYPMPRRGNGNFDVLIVPDAGFDKSALSKCTYEANIKFLHGSTAYKVKNTFSLSFSPGTAPMAKKEPMKAKATEPKKVVSEVKKPVEEKKAAVVAKVDEKKTEIKTGMKEKKAGAMAKMETKKEEIKTPLKSPMEKVMPKKEEPKKTLTVEKVEPVKKESEPGNVKPVEPVTPEPKKLQPVVEAKTEAPTKPAVVEPEKPVEKTAEPKTAAPVKTNPMEPEDMPEPEEVVVSEEAQLAMVQMPKKPDVKVVSSPSASSDFKMGLEAYAAGQMEKAIASLSKVAKPASKKRGDPQRDEYVQANFHMGLATQKLGSLKQAIKAYQEVLDYEKYFPIANMNLGICYMEMRQFGKANRAFRNVERDQNRIAPEQFDDIMQRTRYFWALTWTRMHRASTEPDRKDFYKRQATSKWEEYTTWYGDVEKYAKANAKAVDYLNTLK